MLHIVTDSSSDLPQDFIKQHGISQVPLTSNIDGVEYIEGINITPKEFYDKMFKSKTLPKTAQPSPASFVKVFEELGSSGDEILCLTISSKLSGAYQSACLAKDLSKKNVTVFDSHAASSGHCLQVMRAVELKNQGLSLKEIIKELTEYRDQMNILILMDTLDNIVKGGRLNKVYGSIANFMNLKFLLQGIEGAVYPVEKIRGKRRFLGRVVEIIGERKDDFSDTVFGITHVDNLEDVEFLKDEITKLYHPKGFVINYMGPTVSTYSGKNAIIISF